MFYWDRVTYNARESRVPCVTKATLELWSFCLDLSIAGITGLRHCHPVFCFLGFVLAGSTFSNQLHFNWRKIKLIFWCNNISWSSRLGWFRVWFWSQMWNFWNGLGLMNFAKVLIKEENFQIQRTRLLPSTIGRHSTNTKENCSVTQCELIGRSFTKSVFFFKEYLRDFPVGVTSRWQSEIPVTWCTQVEV